MANSNEYMAAYMLQRYHDRRNAAIKELGGVCIVCGSTDNLEIDHIDPKTKTMSISKMWSCSKEKYMAEIKLCQLLCYTHHRIKTSAERSVEHGKGLTGKKNCRCALCGPLKNAYSSYIKSLRS